MEQEQSGGQRKTKAGEMSFRASAAPIRLSPRYKWDKTPPLCHSPSIYREPTGSMTLLQVPWGRGAETNSESAEKVFMRFLLFTYSHPIREDFQSRKCLWNKTLPPRPIPGNSGGKGAGSKYILTAFIYVPVLQLTTNLVGENNQNLFSYNSGGSKSEIKLLARLCYFKDRIHSLCTLEASGGC
jgi:hypothetical protein